MRTDLSPLYRSTVGFDRLFSMLDQVPNVEAAPAYPPYNIERTGENAYRITLAVAGFGEADLTIETRENGLLVKGARTPTEAPKADVLYQGIAGRAFERRFQLAEHVQVTGASLENWAAACRSRARGAGSQEAASDRDRQGRRTAGRRGPQGRVSIDALTLSRAAGEG